MEVDERPVSANIVIEDAALVQADWDLVLKEMSNPKFYVGRRKYGEGSSFANVEKSGDNFVCADEEIQISVQQSCVELVVLRVILCPHIFSVACVRDS
nr:WD40 repeat domain containing protein [Haemonchus contortus]